MSKFSLSVQCVTCGRALRITDPSLVGTIAVCPACGSMVQIEDPLKSEKNDFDRKVSPPSLAIGNAVVDSGAVTEESILAEGVLSGAPPPSGFSGKVPTPHLNSDDPVTAPPGLNWQSEQSQKTRKIGLLIATITLALVAISAIVYAIIDRPGPQAASKDPDADSSSLETPALESEKPTELEPAPTQKIESEPVTSSEHGKAETPTPLQPATEQDPADEPKIDSGLSSLMPQPVINTPSEPLGNPKAAIPAETDPTSNMSELAEELIPFIPFVLNEDPPTKPSLPALPSLEDVVLKDAADEDEPLDAATDRVINPVVDLAIVWNSQANGEICVPYWLFLIGSITDVPIELDLVSFDVAGIDVRKNFAPDATAKKASQLLDEVAASIQGQIRFEPTFGVISPNPEAFNAAVQSIIDRSDLPDATEPLQSFLRIQAEDDRLFSSEDGNGQVASVHDRLLAALSCESFRQMRQVKPKMESHRLARWAQPLSDPKGGWTDLKETIIATQPDAPITLARFFQIVGKSSNSHVMVNWMDFTKRGTGPATRVFPDVFRDPPGAIARTLAAKGATVRRIDDQFLWVGNEATYDRLPILVWSEPLQEHRSAFEDQLKLITAKLPMSETRYTYDPISDRALIMVPRFIRRQITELLRPVKDNP